MEAITYERSKSPVEAVMEKIPTRQDEVPNPLRKTPLTCTIKQPGCVHVTHCGHKFDPRDQPRNNCGYCWFVYWDLHPAEVAAGQSVIKVYGKGPIIKSKGLKYFKALQKAVEAYEWKQTQEALAKQMDMQGNQEQTDSSSSFPNSAIVKSDEPSVSSTTPATT